MTNTTSTKFAAAGLILATMALTCILESSVAAQTKAPVPSQDDGHRPLPPPDSSAANRRTRLILKDGSYQIVMSYRITGKVVHYVSAERGAAEEDIPLDMVDLDATRRYASRNSVADDNQAPVLDPELLKEEAERAALTPEVVPDLRLSTEDSVLAFDIFQGTPELVPMPQAAGDLNHNTAHNVLRGVINPLASAHQIVQLKGEAAPVQMHINTPVLYLRVGDVTASPTAGEPLVVDTHGASAQAPTAPGGGSATSRYVIVRTDVRTGARVIASFKINLLGGVRRQEDVIETNTELLPGGHWMKVTPREPLDFGEFALMEVLSDKEINLGVWDFGVHPVAPENRDIVKPEDHRPATLTRRRPATSD